MPHPFDSTEVPSNENKMLSDEVIERFKTKIPVIKGDHTIYGITQLDIQCADGELKQIGEFD